ncbi:predicted protein [Chaetoceros tenuissimus]|uniref:Uncharacterized protein n=1 Tax=Chaetoceros tenuissimus TaxID=426638 RepID=A0AAD3D0Y7_9STRA|nr:predicted protein [Chaetoceros tenuissimus]
MLWNYNQSASKEILLGINNKLKEYSTKLQASLAKIGDGVAAARDGSNVSVQCFTGTLTNYDFMIDLENTEAAFCSLTSCDYSSIGLPACVEAGGSIVRDTVNVCEEGFTLHNVPFCISSSCDEGITYANIILDFFVPVMNTMSTEVSMEEMMSAFGTCEMNSSPKSSKSPSSKQPKSSVQPKSSKTPKSTKGPESSSSGTTSSTKAPKSTKSPESTKSPSSKSPKSTKAPKGGTISQAQSSSGSTMTTAAATAAAAPR